MTERTYYIYDAAQHNAYVGEVLAISVDDAEYIAAGTFFDHNVADMFAVAANEF